MKFNEKPLANALNVISKLEPVEFDQTQCLIYHYTPESPQSHHCGFIAQSVHEIEELKHAVVGGEVDDDGKESIERTQLQCRIHLCSQGYTGATRNSKGATDSNKRATRTASEPLVDELCGDYIVIDAKLVLYMLRVAVVCV